PLPNNKREPAARWDAYLYVPDPDALAAEFASRNVEFSEPLKDTHDGLRGFELKDCDGYVWFLAVLVNRGGSNAGRGFPGADQANNRGAGRGEPHTAEAQM